MKFEKSEAGLDQSAHFEDQVRAAAHLLAAQSLQPNRSTLNSALGIKIQVNENRSLAGALIAHSNYRPSGMNTGLCGPFPLLVIQRNKWMSPSTLVRGLRGNAALFRVSAHRSSAELGSLFGPGRRACMRSMAAKKPMAFRGTGVASLRDRLRQLDDRWPLLEPLPVTRFLGQSFGISNVSAHRVLSRLAADGVVWQAPSGRYFRPEARRLMERPQPLACLLRRLERWTEVGRLIMQGADEACGAMDRALLLVHDRALYRQAEATSPTRTGSDAALTASLEDFLLLHGEGSSGMLLDELWPDRVLSRFRDRLRHGVVLYRSTKLRWLGQVTVDLRRTAGFVLDHARQRGFQRIVVVDPAYGYPPSSETVAAVVKACASHHLPHRKVTFRSPAPFRKMLREVCGSGRRTLIVATEDNLALSIHRVRLALPSRLRESTGLMSTMGTGLVRDQGITSVAADFRALGAAAARLAVAGRASRVAIAPEFCPGETT